MTLASRSLAHPIPSLLIFFVVWKSWLLLVAALSPSPAYDTSTSLLLRSANASSSPLRIYSLQRLLESLTRWDAIYFTRIADRDYLFEQEWAFGCGFTRAVKLLSIGLARCGFDFPGYVQMAAGVLIAHTSHLLSVLVLYYLTRTVFRQDQKLALISALLHVISPAGLFLSAPCAESLFSLLSFTSLLLYAQSLSTRRIGWEKDVRLVLSGLVAGVATTVRSNGILAGMPFFCDALLICFNLCRDRSSISISALQRLAALVVGGTFVAGGMFVPQWIAYNEYCAHHSSRPWCTRTIPSIYSWNQDHYWHVGFLRYWTLSNLPLFLLAAPMLVIMSTSAVWAIKGDVVVASRGNRQPKQKERNSTRQEHDEDRDITRQCLWRFALPQLSLTVLALLVYHVQIISRISSGYVIWYWWLAWTISAPLPSSGGEAAKAKGKRRWTWEGLIVKWMVIYGTVQGGLFASFLPPA